MQHKNENQYDCQNDNKIDVQEINTQGNTQVSNTQNTIHESNNSQNKIYQNRKMVLLTKHKKEEVIKAILEQKTGCQLIVVDDFDTDTFGTFSRDIKRPDSQLGTAMLKIQKGMELTGTDLGIASEGSFGSHPYIPMPWNTELVVLYDKKEDFQIYGVHESGDTNLNHMQTSDYHGVLKFAEEIGFPQHYLIMRPDNEESGGIIKGINNYQWLEEAFQLCLSKSDTGQVFIETDMRAHANPTRMENIKKATEDLVKKLLQTCPKCDAPGFIVSDKVRGLPCELCGLPTDLVLKNIKKCYRCNHIEEEEYPNGEAQASPQYCNFCNP